ncbi:hypothetical protein C8R46DRAFT_1283977 [Mycena filopes]|nr:hypothetical protein C8R46DRAFT_1283977 [Mycena filopes]
MNKPNGPAVDAAFDISTTVSATLTTAASSTSHPLNNASILALTISNTVRGAERDKKSFNALANDACELVSAIICVYNDMEKDGLELSENLKPLDDLVNLLQSILKLCQSQEHVSNENIQQYRAQLQQVLDVLLQSQSITIHETVVQILTELGERDDTKGSQPSSPSSPPPSSPHAFDNLLGQVSGHVSINYISGSHTTYQTYRTTTNVNRYTRQSRARRP